MKQLILFSALALLALPSPVIAKVIGQFQVVKGEVKLVSKRGRKKNAKYGMRVKEGQTIETGKNSRAKIVMLDKNIIHVSPDSRMKFGKYNQKIKQTEETVLDVVYGKIRTNVKGKYDDEKKKFRVRTKAAVAGVRGTDWLTKYDRKTKKAEFTTFKGKVRVGLVGPNGKLTNWTTVGAGQTSSTKLGKTPTKSKKMDEKKFNEEKSGSETKGGKDTYDKSLPDDQGESGKKKEEGGQSDGQKKESKSTETEKKTEGQKQEPAKKESKKTDGSGEKKKQYADKSYGDEGDGSFGAGSDVPEGELPKDPLPPNPPKLPEAPKVNLKELCPSCVDDLIKSNLNINININD